MPALDSPVQFLKGVGPRRAEMLAKVGVNTVGDLLGYRPLRYEDRSNFQLIKDIQAGREAVIEGLVVVAGGRFTPRKRLYLFEMRVDDGSSTLVVKFFNQRYLDKILTKDKRVVLLGVPRSNDYGSGLCLINPEFEVLDPDSDTSIHTGRIVPVYRRAGQLQSRALRGILFHLLQDLREEQLANGVPADICRHFGFPTRLEAVRQVHFPSQEGDRQRLMEGLRACRTPAHQRLIFEEFFLFHLGLQSLKRRRQAKSKPRRIVLNDQVRRVIKSVLPFHPTGAQKRVLREIVQDLTGPKPMSRLLQGDVGSGKTIVALQAIIVVLENGYQSVLMAPTEILAEQHLRTICRYLAGQDYQVELLSGRVVGKERRAILQRIRKGEVDLVIGTHALFQKGVEFAQLALVVIDEQHRFGVMQRSQLMDKAKNPDTLVMTATPIPRSLALTLYGDLDLSVVDELPPGRQPITTLVLSEKRRDEIFEALRRELRRGRQAYVVYPLVEESQKVDLHAATEMSGYLQQTVFPEYRVGLLHGRLKPVEKDQLMQRFQAGQIQILVSTTVVEVGIDVSNATLMVIENADRFGLSQLHQLRGRIGRGKLKSYCILVVSRRCSAEARERLETMRQTQDGFEIAEKDLEIRGPGEFVGTRQSGLPRFLFANLVRDRKIMDIARRESGRYLQKLQAAGDVSSAHKLAQIAERWKRKFSLFEVG